MTAALILAKFVGRWLLDRWPYVLGVVGVLLALWWAYSAIYDAGYDKANAEWEARQRAAEAKVAQDTIQLQDAMAGIDAGVAIELEAIENVRVVYRDKIRTVAIAADRPDCAIADGLRAQINAAAQGYASAAASAGNATVRPAKPSP